MLIDSTYFNGEINIPNLDSVAVLQRLNWLIEIHEPRFLQGLFGYAFYKLFIAGVAANEQKYLDIRDGVDYTDSYSRQNRWRGLLDKTDNTKKSPIANYVYYHYERSIATQTTGIGEVETVPIGARSATAAEKMALAWNEMSSYCWQFRYFMQAQTSVIAYPDWTSLSNQSYLGEVYKKINSFNFL